MGLIWHNPSPLVPGCVLSSGCNQTQSILPYPWMCVCVLGSGCNQAQYILPHPCVCVCPEQWMQLGTIHLITTLQTLITTPSLSLYPSFIPPFLSFLFSLIPQSHFSLTNPSLTLLNKLEKKYSDYFFYLQFSTFTNHKI